MSELQNRLEEFIAAIQRHHEMSVTYQNFDHPEVEQAAEELADAFTLYDEVLFQECGTELPFDLYFEEEEDDEYEYYETDDEEEEYADSYSEFDEDIDYLAYGDYDEDEDLEADELEADIAKSDSRQ